MVSFYGEYPDGSLGKKHGNYISKKSISGLIEFDPDVIILDFRELSYNLGNSLLGVFQDIAQFKDAGNDENDPEFPIIVITSEKSKNGVLSLLTPSTDEENKNPDWHFSNIEEAIKSAIEKGRYWLNN